jgi:predicted NBD/HSP70 family sugar kinase
VILGVDVHPAATRMVIADAAGAIIARPTGSAQSAAAVIASTPGAGMPYPITACGVAAYGSHDAPSVQAAGEAVIELTGRAPDCVVSRGLAIALAEQWCGAATAARHVAALVLDEQVHTGLLLDGRPFAGAHGRAGAASWMALNPVDRDDYRKVGGLEAEIGLAGIVKRLVWRVKAGDRSRILEAVNGDVTAITATHVFNGARAGDPVAVSVVRDTARYIGMAISNIVTLLDPEIVIVAGAIADAADLLLEPSRAEAIRRLPAGAAAALIVMPSTLGDDAAALGAARAALLSA